MIIEIAVLIGVAVAALSSVALLWRAGVRGWRLIATAWLSLFGFVLTIMMLGHCADVLRNLVIGGQAMDGAPWGYTFRTYALFLLAGVLITQGLVVLRSAAGLARGEAAAWASAMRATLYTLAVVAPLIPIHGFFAIPGTAIAMVSLVVLILLGKGSAEPVHNSPGDSNPLAHRELHGVGLRKAKMAINRIIR